MPQNYIKFSIILSLIMISTACGYQQKVYPNCIRPTQLSSTENEQFFLHEPLSWSHEISTFINPEWTDASICIEPSLSSFNCTDTFKKRYEITPLKANNTLILDGHVRLTRTSGFIGFFTNNRRMVDLRTRLNNDFFWLSTDHLEMLLNNTKNLEAVNLYLHNKSAFDYLKLDNKLKVKSIPKYWPCDPLISPEDKW